MRLVRSLPRPAALALGLLTVLASAGIGASGASGAAAEPVLVSSAPADGEQLAVSPSEIRLQFDQTVSAETTVTVACNGAPAPVGPSFVEPDSVTVVVPVVGALGRSKCNVVWSVPDGAGDSTTGLVTFDVTADAAPTTEAPAPVTPDTVAPADGGTEVAADPASSSRVGGPLGLVRIVAYVALAALFGGLVLIALAWPEGVEYAVTLRYLMISWVAGLVATVLQVVLATAQLGGRSVAGSLSPTAWGDLTDTSGGTALLVRLLLTAACGWVALRPERILDPATRTIALVLPGLAVATWGFSRSGGDLAVVGIPAAVVHALSVSVWFGGLMMLARVVLLGPGDEDLVHAVRGYSRYSMTALVAAVASGAVQVYRLDGGGLLSTSHGRLLLLKGAAVAAMAYLAMAARPVIAQRLGGADHLDGRTASGLRRAVSAEMLVGVLVMAITSWMLSTQPANLEASSTVRYEYDSGRSGGDLDVRVRLTSDEVGRSGVRVEVFAPAEGLADLRVTFRPPADAVGASAVRLEVPLTGAGAAELPAAQGVPFGVPGEWTIEVDADGPDGRFETVVDTVEITGETTPATDPAAVDPSGTAPAGTEAPADS